MIIIYLLMKITMSIIIIDAFVYLMRSYKIHKK